ncbi:MAG TPA: cold shock domain-containing protein [bacterium]|jgi:CspA family cold shock protein
MSKRTKGTVKWFSPEKGYGFIEIDEEEEAFVHFSSIIGDGYKLLNPGETVEFELEDTYNGYKAVNVVRVSSSEHSN